jgi:hypothetical protein
VPDTEPLPFSDPLPCPIPFPVPDTVSRADTDTVPDTDTEPLPLPYFHEPDMVGENMESLYGTPPHFPQTRAGILHRLVSIGYSGSNLY